MSNKVAKIKEDITEEIEKENETKEMAVRLDALISFNGGDTTEMTTYLVITGIPKDLPEEFEPTVLRTAEAQFAQAINNRMFIEFYDYGKSAKDDKPKFINLNNINSIKITTINKIA